MTKPLREELAAAVDPRLFMNYGGRNATIAPTAERARRKKAYDAADRILALLAKFCPDSGQAA